MRRLWRVFDGTGGRTAAGACLIVLAALFAFVVLSSQGGWQWFGGKAVAGRESGGVVIYSYKGQVNSIDDTTSLKTGPRTVWLDPQNPSEATLNSLTLARISDSVFVGVPALVGAALVASGFVGKYRRDRRGSASDSGGTAFGSGIDADTIAKIMSDRQKPGEAEVQ